MDDLAKDKKAKCYNCNHASHAFKVGKVTHHHCLIHRIVIPDEDSPWDSLRDWHNTCYFKPSKHEYKVKS